MRVSYGQRDNFQDMRREDMISFTVAINLPVWRESKRDPRVEAEAMREQPGHVPGEVERGSTPCCASRSPPPSSR